MKSVSVILIVIIVAVLSSVGTLYAVGDLHLPSSSSTSPPASPPPTATISGTNTSSSDIPSYAVNVSSLSNSTIPLSDIAIVVFYHDGNESITNNTDHSYWAGVSTYFGASGPT